MEAQIEQTETSTANTAASPSAAVSKGPEWADKIPAGTEIILRRIGRHPWRISGYHKTRFSFPATLYGETLQTACFGGSPAERALVARLLTEGWRDETERFHAEAAGRPDPKVVRAEERRIKADAVLARLAAQNVRPEPVRTMDLPVAPPVVDVLTDSEALDGLVVALDTVAPEPLTREGETAPIRPVARPVAPRKR